MKVVMSDMITTEKILLGGIIKKTNKIQYEYNFLRLNK